MFPLQKKKSQSPLNYREPCKSPLALNSPSFASTLNNRLKPFPDSKKLVTDIDLECD